MPAPANPKIYHIVHVDKLASIAADGCLWSDVQLENRNAPGTVIGMNHIKERRKAKALPSYPDLRVGECVPFYFCPRSVMLYMMSVRSEQLTYKGGQGPIVHLVADLQETAAWATANAKRWVFTLSNAGSYYFEDRADLAHLGDINWDAVDARNWSGQREAKQAEFLIEEHFPWHLVEEIGVYNQTAGQQAAQAIAGAAHRPPVQSRPEWYY